MKNEDNHKNSFKESPLAWWISTLIALIGIGCFFYDQLKENNPNLTFTIVKEISLLNNKANIPSIHILLDSIDISETNSNLSIYTVKVENCGNQHITKDMYDNNIQLILTTGEYISLPSVTYASSPHIKPHFIDSTLLIDKRILNIPCVPMDKDDIYLFDIILLHPIDSLPSFSAYGKITGQKEISVCRVIKDKTSFWQIAFGGGFWVNVVRVVLSTIFGLALIISLIISVEKIKNTYHKFKLKEAVRKIVSRHPVNQQIVNDINKKEIFELRLMYQWINTSDEEASKKYASMQKKLSSMQRQPDFYMQKEEEMLKHLIENGYLTLTDGKIAINKSMQDDFRYIYKRLKKQHLLNIDIILPL